LLKTIALLRGRVRLARGRCPSCASESTAAVGCGVCRGYQGPFPAEDRTLLRWSWRYDGSLRAPAIAHAQPSDAHWSGVAEPFAR
jgi:hypothetical protein